MSANSNTELISNSSPRRTFLNFLAKENGSWWRTRMWWIQMLIWMAIINGMIAMVLASTAKQPEAVAPGSVPIQVLLYTLFSGMAPMIGMTIIAQDALVEEKQTGTAAWVLSKPLSRHAFFLSKLIANSLGGLVTMVLVPGIIAYIELYFGSHTWTDSVTYLKVMGIIFLHLMFYLTLTLMLGALFQKRGGVIAIPMAVMFGAQLFGSYKPLLYVMPWLMLWPLPFDPTKQESIAGNLLIGQPVPTYWPVICTAIFCVIFIVVGIWRFSWQEF
jgi:ABC-2 type transport system permease protein